MAGKRLNRNRIIYQMLRMIGRKDMKNLSKYLSKNLSKNIFRSPAWGVMCITGGGAKRNRRLGLILNKALQGRDNFMIF
jgi:hypothetical protein